MLKDIIEVRPLDGLRLFVRFEDGVEGVFDVGSDVSLDGVFAALGDPAEFARAKVDAELGTVVWPCGADLDPDVLYARVAGNFSPKFQAPVDR